MVKTRKSLWAAGFALLVCILLLIGTTFAWFTDSVSNKGNVIAAGDLQISVAAYDVDPNASEKPYNFDGINGGESFGFETAGTTLTEESAPIINESLWEPGKSNAKLLTVENKGSLAAKVKVDFEISDTNNLTDALWFDFIQTGTTQGEFIKRPMSGITALGDAREISLGAEESVSFILVYGMDEEAGNEYQGGTFTADVTVLATQDTVEKDGFGNPDYDENAQYDGYASTEDELKAILSNVKDGDTIKITDNISMEHTGSYGSGSHATTADTYIVAENVTVDLGGNTISVTNMRGVPFGLAADGITLKNGTINIANKGASYPLYVTSGAKNVVVEDVTINGGMQVIGNSSATLRNVTVNPGEWYDVYLEHNSVVVVESGTFNNKDGLPHFYTARNTDRVVINGGTFSGGAPTHEGYGEFENNIE